MKIALGTNSYSLLLKHVRPDNIGYMPLTTATKVDGLVNTVDEFWIDCSESDADAYLAIARTQFPECTREIEQAIVNAKR